MMKMCPKCKNEMLKPLPSGSVLCLLCGRIWLKKDEGPEEEEQIEW